MNGVELVLQFSPLHDSSMLMCSELEVGRPGTAVGRVEWISHGAELCSLHGTEFWFLSRFGPHCLAQEPQW